MNKIQYNRKQLLSDFFDCNNIQEVLNKIKAECDKQNQVVCNIKINNKNISVEDEDANLNFELSEIEFIEIETCPYEDFLSEFVASSRSFVKDIIEICPHMAESIHDANYHNFESLFIDFIESMESLTSALFYIRSDFSDKLGDLGWREQEKKLSAVLQQILEAYASKDYVILADLVEYEMIEELESWYKLLDQIDLQEDKDIETAPSGVQSL